METNTENYSAFSEAKIKKLKEKYEIKKSPYSMTCFHYTRYKQKLTDYNNMYSNSKTLYYFFIMKKLTYRFIKRRLLSSIINMFTMMLGLYISKKSGLLDYTLSLKDTLFNKFSSIYNKLKSIIV